MAGDLYDYFRKSESQRLAAVPIPIGDIQPKSKVALHVTSHADLVNQCKRTAKFGPLQEDLDRLEAQQEGHYASEIILPKRK